MDAGAGWQTVMPTTFAGMMRLPFAQLEECERRIVEEWEASRHHWSGLGKHLPLDDSTEAKKLHERFKLASDIPLGSGSFGVVQKVQFSANNRSICLARKLVRPPHRRYPIQLLREEANVMEKLSHEHVIKLVGTYCIQSSLYLLLWPVAVCNLDILIGDIDSLRTGQGDKEDIVGRLHSLDLKDLDAIYQPRAALKSTTNNGQGNCPIEFLRQVMGCITRAVAYCHNENIRHLDLKPSNILLNPGRVYLADFGIAKDVHDRENTMTRGMQGTPKWRAPELQQCREDWSMKAADVYSLGMVLLSISTTISYGPLDEFDAMLCDVSRDGRIEKLNEFLRKIEALALATQAFEDVNAPTFGPKHPVELIRRMVSKDPSTRPVISQVDAELVELGGIDQAYHSHCCKWSSRFVTKRLNAKFKEAVEERNRLRAERERLNKRLQVLEAKDATYESRILHERKLQADNVAKLQAQLDKERAERKRLEAQVAELQQSRRPPRPGIPRPATEIAINTSTGALTTVRTRRTHPVPTPETAPQRPPTTRVQQPSPAPSATSGARLSYSQTAAAAAAAAAAATVKAISRTPSRRGSLIPSPLPSPAIGAGPSPSHSPSAELVGYPLRSRPSGSRLPLAIHPTTPIRSITPSTMHRDPSSTDSTQYSMSSSVFDRLSGSKTSLAEPSSAVSTPPVPTTSIKTTKGSGTVLDMRRAASPPPKEREPSTERGRSRERRLSNEGEEMGPLSPRIGHGLGLGLTDPDQELDREIRDKGEVRERRESVVSKSSGVAIGTGSVVNGGGESVQDSASIASFLAGAAAAASPVLSASVLSSPRGGFASLSVASGGSGGRGPVPPLPTGKSWAEIARRDKRT
ncbi:hypothetical protein VTJ83DRAFT_7118 [Remersonia thermophila]|uniref:Protein kinase domain-containing protein n=1 Tax=Remersonia thermophila TaxID=72144 RepID=A0ABR4D2J8_9PEZI